jgi:hypothetical protein
MVSASARSSQIKALLDDNTTLKLVLCLQPCYSKSTLYDERVQPCEGRLRPLNVLYWTVLRPFTLGATLDPPITKKS